MATSAYTRPIAFTGNVSLIPEGTVGDKLGDCGVRRAAEYVSEFPSPKRFGLPASQHLTLNTLPTSLALVASPHYPAGFGHFSVLMFMAFFDVIAGTVLE